LSSTASAQVTNIVNKITGDKNLSVDLRYKTYASSSYDAASLSSSDISRNQLSLGVRKNLFNDRLSVQVGSAYDWGRASSSNSTTNNLAGDFRIEYLLQEGGNLRLNIFRNSNYDALVDKNVNRGGAGLSWRKSYDDFWDLFRGQKYAQRKNRNTLELMQTDTASTDKRSGTE
jgi:hypothetical protein